MFQASFKKILKNVSLKLLLKSDWLSLLYAANSEEKIWRLEVEVGKELWKTEGLFVCRKAKNGRDHSFGICVCNQR
jgi:hypothetical protein